MNKVISYSKFTAGDIALFQEGRHTHLYRLFGAHKIDDQGQHGVYFAVWAPHALSVAVIGPFNNWNKDTHKLHLRNDASGVWEGLITEATDGDMYKYSIATRQGYITEKADPFAQFAEIPPHTSSIVYSSSYKWSDNSWIKNRKKNNSLQSPMCVYEVHLESWRRKNNDTQPLTYKELAAQLVPYVLQMQYTHVEFMPIMHYPYHGSWGYQITGYYSASPRFGTPDELKYLINEFHLAGIGVLLDWVPSHFPGDAHGLLEFDGTHLYEHPDPQRGYQPDWKSYIFNYGLHEVRSFLISNAVYWLEQFHADGLRVDAVASMLHRNFSRNDGEWTANIYGGNENLEAVAFIQMLNEAVNKLFPYVQTIAEESTSWKGVSRPVFTGGLGFGMKWMMGWMNDTFKFFKRDPIHRKYHMNELSFSCVYAFDENFMLPLSHDEVVHGKASLIYKMPGTEQQKFANLRTLFAYMYAHPGTKLLFMGNDFAQTNEWNHQASLSWHLLQYKPHQGIQQLIIRLNNIYTHEKALHVWQFDPKGFEWITGDDTEHTVIAFVRHYLNESIAVVLNLVPVPHHHYKLGIPYAGKWECILNTNDEAFGGENSDEPLVYNSYQQPWHYKNHHVVLHLPAMSALLLKNKRRAKSPIPHTKKKEAKASTK